MKKQKRLISLMAAITAASLAASPLTAAVYAAPAEMYDAVQLYGDDARTVINDWGDEYELRDGEYAVNGWIMSFDKETGTLKELAGGYTETSYLNIPAEIDGVKVKHIGGGDSFLNDWYVEEINIPDGIESIGDYAFRSGYMTSVTIPGSVKTIGKEAFRYCDSLRSVTIPGGVKTIGERAFYECSELETAVIEDGVEMIGDNAFEDCNSLRSVTLPDSLKEIGRRAFYTCYELEELKLPGGLEKIGNAAFNENTEITGKENYILSANDYEDEVPANITCIADGALNELGSISVSEDNARYKSVDGVLYSKDGTELVTYPNGKLIEQADNGAEKITIPEGVTKIENYAFYRGGDINIDLPNGVKSIGKSAFEDLGGSVNLPDTLTEIGENAFSGSGITSAVIPAGVERIEDRAFDHCDNLAKLTLGKNVKYIGSDAFSASQITELVIPDSVERIEDSAFDDCAFLAALTLGNNIKTIGECAFSHIGITELIIPDSVERIEDRAFEDCDNLAKLTLGKNVKYIGGYAFSASQITELVIPDSVETIEYDAFAYAPIETVNIPAAVKELDDPFVYCAELKAITVDAGNKYYKAVDGVLFTADGEILVHYPAKMSGTEYTVPDGVKDVGSFATNKLLEKLTIPDGAEQIFGSAFENCDALAEITIPDSVKYIGYDAFASCRSLKSVKLPAGLEEINGRTFIWCEALETVTIPDTVTTIGNHAFDGCKSLAEIDIPDSVNVIADAAFSGCSALKSVVIPDGVSVIDYRAFEDCTALKSVTIPDSVETIGYCAFERCKSLEKINVPSGVEEISSWAFKDCEKLAEVFIPETVQRMDNYAFEGCSPDLVIYGYAGTYAQTFAEENSIQFSAVPQAVGVQAVRDADNKTVTVTLTPPEGGNEPAAIPDKAIFAVQNGTSLLSTQELDGTNGVFTVQDTNDASYIKVYFWDSLDGMQPIDGMEPVIVGLN